MPVFTPALRGTGAQNLSFRAFPAFGKIPAMNTRQIFSCLGFMVFVGIAPGVLPASDAEMIEAQNLPDLPKDKLPSVANSYLENKMSDLERRLRQLEDEIQFLDERTRSLDRSVNDLRRR